MREIFYRPILHFILFGSLGGSDITKIMVRLLNLVTNLTIISIMVRTWSFLVDYPDHYKNNGQVNDYWNNGQIFFWNFSFHFLAQYDTTRQNRTESSKLRWFKGKTRFETKRVIKLIRVVQGSDSVRDQNRNRKN